MDSKTFERKFNALKQEAESWLSTWKDIRDFVNWKRGFFDGEKPNQGGRKDTKIIDGTPLRASRSTGAGMQASITSPQRPWFRLGVQDPDINVQDSVKAWLSTVEQRMLAILSKSNIYKVLHVIYEELAVFGTAAAVILPDFDTIIRGRVFTCGQYYLGVGPDQRVNTFSRTLFMTVAQVVKEFGEENCSLRINNMMRNNNTEEWIEIMHIIEPNENHQDGAFGSRGFKYISTYREKGAPRDQFLRESGFRKFPVLAPRWDTTTDADIYGKGPGWDALGDSKMLQTQQRHKLQAIDKLVNPPVKVPAGTVNINGLPGGVTVVNGAAGASQNTVGALYQINPDIVAIDNSIRETQVAIKEAFFVDLFLLFTQSDRREQTATEVAEKSREKLLMLGPVLENLESELLDPLIEIVYDYMLEHNLIPPPPEELAGLELKVEYVSILAQAQKLISAPAVESFAAFAGNIIGVAPEVKDKIDWDNVIETYGDIMGVPPRLIRSDEETADIRQQQAAAVQQQQQAEQGMATVQGAKVLSETDTGSENALTALMGGVMQ